MVSTITLAASVAGMLLVSLAATTAATPEARLSVALAPAADNPTSPQMGDHLAFSSVIRNDSPALVDGVIAWISLVRTDPGEEQPVDLEDWSAHKAVAAATLAPGQAMHTDWPMRLIQSGHYRVVVSASSWAGGMLAVSPLVDFVVRPKPVVESVRVLPVAFGMPLLLGGLLTLRLRRR
jgi:hypothetical protein